MADLNAQFHFSLARVAAVQLLRAAGVERARPSVVDSLTDVLTKYIVLLGQRSKVAAEMAGRHKCELEDFRVACESLGAISTVQHGAVREEEGVIQFINWCMSDEVADTRRVAGEGKDEMGEEVSSDWLGQLIQTQIKVTGESRFKDTVLATSLAQTIIMPSSNGDAKVTNGKAMSIEGLAGLPADTPMPEVVRDFAGGAM